MTKPHGATPIEPGRLATGEEIERSTKAAQALRERMRPYNLPAAVRLLETDPADPEAVAMLAVVVARLQYSAHQSAAGKGNLRPVTNQELWEDKAVWVLAHGG